MNDQPTLDFDQAQATGVRLAGRFLLNLSETVKIDDDNDRQFRRQANVQINSDVGLTKIVVKAFMEFMTSDQISAGLNTREATLELVIGQFFRTDRVQKLLLEGLGGVWSGKWGTHWDQPVRGVTYEITRHAFSVLGFEVVNAPSPKPKGHKV